MADPLRIDPTSAILDRYTHDAPVQVEAIASALGIAVSPDVMNAEVAGQIVKDVSGRSPSGFAIHINARDPHRRQRFTLAHELGHYVLHLDLIGDGLTDDALYRSKLGDWHERQANRWAANTLMPAGLVSGLYIGGMTSPTELSDALDVSEQAVRIRLSELRVAPRVLPARPDAVQVRAKTPTGTGGLRRRWLDPDGTIYEWDYQHGTVRVYDRNGHHLGEIDPYTGERLARESDRSRRIEP
jgi:hypothetical protein